MKLSIYYLVNIAIIIVWLPFFFISTKHKSEDKEKVYNVVLIGCNLHSAILAHQLKKYPRLNITILEEGQCFFESQKHFPQSTAIVELFEQLNFKYKFASNSIGFWDGNTLLTTDTDIQTQLFKFGLSSYALKSSLTKFDNWLKKCYKKSFLTIFECLQRLQIQTTMTNSKYLLDELGLDRQYVRLIITPYLRGSEQELDSNFLNLKLKLIQMFVPLLEFKGQQRDLGFRMMDGVRLLDEQGAINVSNRRSSQYNISTVENNLTTKFIIFSNYSETKQWFFKTVVKGKIDPSYYSVEQFLLPSMIYSNQNVVKVKKQCTISCTKAESNLYIITSKSRTTEKDLRMFRQFQIISWQRYKVSKLINNLRELPKITDGKGHYFMNAVDPITDSKQFAILFARNIASLISQQISH